SSTPARNSNSSTPARNSNSAQKSNSSTPAQYDPYAEMRMLQARWNQLTLQTQGSTPESSPSPRRRVYKPRARTEKTPDDKYEMIDLKSVSMVLKSTAHTLCMILMGRATPKSPFPPPPDQFYNRSIQQF
ncbi:hypothetical protein DFH28DRAFT_842073, partial [Melampsora americana]